MNRSESFSANKGENMSCPRETFHFVIIGLTDSRYSNVYYMMI